MHWVWPMLIVGAKWVREAHSATGPPIGGRVGMFRWTAIPAADAEAFAAANPLALNTNAFFAKVQEAFDANRSLLPALKPITDTVESVVRAYPRYAVFVWIET
jgi:hypothetical protein